MYTSVAAWNALAEWDRYLLRVHAFDRTRPGVPFAFESAAALQRLPVFGHPRDVHVFDPRRGRSVRYGDVIAHTSADPRTFVEGGGVRMTSVADTVLDLGRVLPAAFGLAVVDAGLRSGVDVDELRAVVADRRDPRGRRRLEWVLDRGDGAAESPGESVSRAVIEWCGFPPPRLQMELRAEGSVYRADFAWPDDGILGESDGWGKYDLADPVAARRRLADEKRREDALRRAGWRFARWDDAGALAVAPIRDALLAAGLPTVRRPDAARLATAGRNPRSR